ncbi:hypothetical protein BDD14_1007 [Edaphobacter modestus]|uniref:Uncharacterized protein n=1 Tax=Edaphobacter modestus TaxID=388466 RepID=A0A4Q7YQ79_9BACT|nr:hypothetical protein BDD14_1007 [Edaphobacter modestus]
MVPARPAGCLLELGVGLAGSIRDEISFAKFAMKDDQHNSVKGAGGRVRDRSGGFWSRMRAMSTVDLVPTKPDAKLIEAGEYHQAVLERDLGILATPKIISNSPRMSGGV